MKMSIRDNIDWCQRQIDTAKDTLGGNRRGSRYFVNGEETSSKKAKATAAIIAIMAAVISAYASMPH
jgi:hypothetical protein